MGKSKRIGSLEAIRVIMMLIIFISHLEFLNNYSYGTFYNNYFHNATLGVDYFFLISGFGMMKGYSNNNKNNVISSVKYALSKIKKIYFIYIISLLCMLPYTFLTFSSNNWLRKLFSILIRFLVCLTMTQSLSGISSISHTINGVCWFLSTIFIIYILCPFIMNILQKYSKSNKKTILGTIITILLCAFIRAVSYILSSQTVFDDLSYGFPLIRILYVVLGMWICKLTELKFKNILNKNWELIVEIFTSIIAVAWFLFRNSFHLSHWILLLIDLIVCGTILFVFSKEKGALSKGMSKSILCKLSKYTMYVFLFHYPIRNYIDLLFDKNRFYFGQITGFIEVLIISLLTILVVIFVRMIDEKIQSKIARY